MPAEKDLKTYVPQVGRVEWIGIADERLAAIRAKDEVDIAVGHGIVGEHHAQGNDSKRQVTLIQHEHLPFIGAILGRDPIDPRLLRRNIVVSGINLIALKDRKFRIGEVILEGTGPCAPCSRMEENLGDGGYAAMRGHGGICTIVHEAGTVRVGDKVHVLED